MVRKGGYTDNEDSWKEEKEESIRRGTWKRWIDRLHAQGGANVCVRFHLSEKLGSSTSDA